MNESLDLSNLVTLACGEISGHSDVGLYVHIPFCVKRCHFCAFYLVIQKESRIERFIQALEGEVASYGDHLSDAGKYVSTVYVGGGTPTALSFTQLSNILAKIRSRISLTDDCEVTVEATPESLTSEYLHGLLQAGVTRLSMGLQTFDPTERSCLGLSSTLEEATRGIQLVKQVGFTNFNLDLIYGIPGQTSMTWERTLQRACEYDPAHLSCYALSVEEGTSFDAALQRGELKQVETYAERVLLEQAVEHLEAAGYAHYEISNWSKPGRACRHNLRYWQGEDYLGLGPSAQSFFAGYRFGNVSNLEQYCGTLENSQSPITQPEQLSIIQRNKERVVFGLRMLDGVPNNLVETNKHDPIWAASLASFLNEDYLVQTHERLALTVKGRQFADEIGSQLL